MTHSTESLAMDLRIKHSRFKAYKRICKASSNSKQWSANAYKAKQVKKELKKAAIDLRKQMQLKRAI